MFKSFIEKVKEKPFVQKDLDPSLVSEDVTILKDGVLVRSRLCVEKLEDPLSKLDSSLYSLKNIVESGNLSLLKEVPSFFRPDISEVEEGLNKFLDRINQIPVTNE